MVNLENKVIYENLRKKELVNYIKGTFIFLIMAVIISFGIYNILALEDIASSASIEQIKDNNKVIENKYVIKDIDIKEWKKILITVNTPLFILMLFFFYKGYKYGKEADKYCPYCYTYGFTTTTLNTKKIRKYIKREKYKDSDGIERTKRVLYEDWEGQYRNECCGTVYDKKWTEKIDLG